MSSSQIEMYHPNSETSVLVSKGIEKTMINRGYTTDKSKAKKPVKKEKVKTNSTDKPE